MRHIRANIFIFAISNSNYILNTRRKQKKTHTKNTYALIKAHMKSDKDLLLLFCNPFRIVKFDSLFLPSFGCYKKRDFFFYSHIIFVHRIIHIYIYTYIQEIKKMYCEASSSFTKNGIYTVLSFVVLQMCAI